MASRQAEERVRPAAPGDVSFDSDLLPPRDRVELSRAFLASSYRLEPAAGGELRAKAVSLGLGAVRLTHGSLSSASLNRKADEPTSHAEEQVSFFLTTGGRWAGRAGRQTKDARPGELVLLDRSQGLSGAIENLSSVTLVLPKRLLLTEIPALEDMHGQTLVGPMAGLLTDQIASSVRHGAQLDPAERLSLGRMVAHLATGALSKNTDRPAEHVREAVDAALRERARRFIAQHCRDPRLTPAGVAAALRVSRTGLYRIFEPEGGVARLIRQARLEAARAALQDRGDTRRIGVIGFDHGFGSEAQFSRAVRQAFGCSPSDLRHGAPAFPPRAEV